MARLHWFYDSKCTKLISILENIGFSRDIIDAGEKTEVVYYIKNVTQDKIDRIKITVDDGDVKVLQESNVLEPNQSMAVHLTFFAPETREEPLQTIIRVHHRVIKVPKGWRA